jgi:hypothetical protein
MQHEKWLRAVTILIFMILSVPSSTLGQSNSGEVLVPKGTTFALELLSPIDTNSNKKGDKFDCKVLSPVEFAGAIISGHLRKVKSSGKANKKSEIDLGFDTITFVDGRVAGFNASVKEVNDVKGASNEVVADNEGTVKGKSRVKVGVKRAVGGAIAGAAIGALIGGPKGAVAGAIIGAGVGVTTTLATEGPNLEFKTGTQFTVMVDSPSTLKKPLSH